MIFGVQVRYLKFFNYFFAFNVFEHMLLIWSALTALYLIIRPNDKPEVLIKFYVIKQEKFYLDFVLMFET